MISSLICFASLGLACGNPQPKPPSTYSVALRAPIRANASATFQEQSVQLLRSIVPAKSRKGVYDMDRAKLTGSTVSDLYALYIGYAGKIPHSLTINWTEQLKKLWDRKEAISKKSIVTATAKMVVAEFERLDPELMTIGEYEAVANAQSRLVYRNLNWNSVAATYFTKADGSVDMRRSALLKRIMSDVTGRTLVAYQATEQFPSSGNYSIRYLAFLLPNAGRRYVESLPAIHDGLTSFGSFQFTALAVNDSGAPKGGASVVNRALPESLRIPGSVTLLRGNQHFRAAYLFGVHNFAMFIRKLDGKRLATFERIANSRRLDLAQFLATAHNKPAVAYKAAAKWLDANAKSDYRASCPEISRRYASKTFENFKALTLLAAL